MCWKNGAKEFGTMLSSLGGMCLTMRMAVHMLFANGLRF
jgi:hypothetical protein